MFPVSSIMHNETRKQELALAYQLLAHLKLDDHTYTHLSTRSEEGDSFYIYPFGLRFEEVDRDCLMKVSLEGVVIEGDEFQYNRTGYIIHGNIYKARPDIKSIFHIHTPEIVAVSACAQGLMPLSQWALHFHGKVAYHDYDSLALDNAQGNQLTKDLGDNFTLLLRNHGSITCGRTLQEALFYTYHLQLACKTQCLTLAMNQPLMIPSEETCRKTVHDLLSFEKNLGQRDWQAWMRLLKASRSENLVKFSK